MIFFFPESRLKKYSNRVHKNGKNEGIWEIRVGEIRDKSRSDAEYARQ